MARTIVIEEAGGPDNMKLVDRPTGDPGPGQIRIRHKACGLNFIDVYQRTGLYPLELPHALGMEAAGIVEAVGEGVTHLKEGDRAAYASMPPGAYSEERLIPADKLVTLPSGVSDEQAAAMMLKGLTVHYLLFRTFSLQAGQTALIHAAAGGVGLIAGQWAAHLGATLIGTVGSAEKAEKAKANGYHHVINYREENFVERVKDITDGQGVDVVYDSIGQDTYPHSLDCLKRLGTWVCFGQSSGMITNFKLSDLAQKGSLVATRPMLFDFIATREELETAAEALFSVVASGVVTVAINQKFALSDAVEAHRQLEGRQTTGSTILIP